jgi:hypothetical protein
MKKKPVPVLIPFLILVSMLFIGILIYAYVETKKANPQMIEVGRSSEVGQTIAFCRLSTRRRDMTDHERRWSVPPAVLSS